MACELLQGIDLDALSPPEGGARHPLQLPDGLGGATLAQWLDPDAASPASRFDRCPPLRSNHHWHPRALHAAVAACAAGEGTAPDLGFAATAIEDFRHVWQAKLDGRLAGEARFVVALPTPYSMLGGLPPQTCTPALLTRLEARVAAEIATLVDTVPPTELAFQWDVCGETRIWESRGRNLAAPRELPERLLASFVALAGAVPAEAQIGWHFCHRDPDGAAAGTAPDCAQVTRLAGAIIASTDREPAFLHLPVPADCAVEDYFTPLANLGLWPAMQVSLGLVHEGDDVETAWRRLYAASGALARVGIAPACGVDAARVRPVLEQLLLRAAGEVPVGD